MAKKSAPSKRKTTGRAKAAKRSLVSPKGNKRYVRRSAAGQFRESDDVGPQAETRYLIQSRFLR